MLLRKHIGSARITAIRQPELERVVESSWSISNELGDVCPQGSDHGADGQAQQHYFFCDDQNMILDGIKHVSCNVSSVREILPGRPTSIPHSGHKLDPLTISKRQTFMEKVCGKSTPFQGSLQTLTGLSLVMVRSFAHGPH